MINIRYNKTIESKSRFCGIKIIDANIEQLISKEEYEKFEPY